MDAVDVVGDGGWLGGEVALVENTQLNTQVVDGLDFNFDNYLNTPYTNHMGLMNSGTHHPHGDFGTNLNWTTASDPSALFNFGDDIWRLDGIAIEQILSAPPPVFNAGEHVELGNFLGDLNNNLQIEATSFNHFDSTLEWEPEISNNNLDSCSGLPDLSS